MYAGYYTQSITCAELQDTGLKSRGVEEGDEGEGGDAVQVMVVVVVYDDGDESIVMVVVLVMVGGGGGGGSTCGGGGEVRW